MAVWELTGSVHSMFPIRKDFARYFFYPRLASGSCLLHLRPSRCINDRLHRSIEMWNIIFGNTFSFRARKDLPLKAAFYRRRSSIDRIDRIDSVRFSIQKYFRFVHQANWNAALHVSRLFPRYLFGCVHTYKETWAIFAGFEKKVRTRVTRKPMKYKSGTVQNPIAEINRGRMTDLEIRFSRLCFTRTCEA